MSDAADDGSPKQVDSPNYHNENHTAAQTCGWTTNVFTTHDECWTSD